MTDALALALPFFGLIALGFFCGRVKSFGEAAFEGMNFYIVYVALPALFYRILSKTPIEQLNNPPFIVTTTAATATVFALSGLYTWFVTHGRIDKAAIGAGIGAYGNIGYMGPGLALSAIGPQAASPVALIFCFETILMFVMVPLLMALSGAGDTRPLALARQTFVKIVTHPFMLATFVGTAAAALHVEIPESLDKLLFFLQGSAAPVALFTLGVTVALRMKSVSIMLAVGLRILPQLLTKLVLHPLIMLAFLALFGPFDRLWVETAVMMAALPPALTVFILARQYDVSLEEASNSVLLGTLLSGLTLTFVLFLIASHALPIR